MINDLKLGIKLMRYAYMLKANVAIAILMVVFGVCMTFGVNLSGVVSHTSGGYIVMLAPLFLIQMLSSVSVTNMAQASSAKRRLQTSVPTAINLFFMLLGYIIVSIVEYICVAVLPERRGMICGDLFLAAILSALLIIYVAVGYKYFAISILLVGPAIMGSVACGNVIGWGTKLFAGMKHLFAFTVVAGIVIIAAACVLHYFITLALYKVPMSKYAQAAPLRRQL